MSRKACFSTHVARMRFEKVRVCVSTVAARRVDASAHILLCTPGTPGPHRTLDTPFSSGSQPIRLFDCCLRNITWLYLGVTPLGRQVCPASTPGYRLRRRGSFKRRRRKGRISRRKKNRLPPPVAARPLQLPGRRLLRSSATNARRWLVMERRTAFAVGRCAA